LVEREWREASDMRPSRVNLALVLIAAAVLRFWGLRHGLPYSPAIDEPEIVDRALAMMRTGTLSPHPFYDYPALYMYVQLAVFIVRFLIGAFTGAWTSLNAIDPVQFYVAGRAVTALIGTATVLLVFQAGMRWGARHALLAAGLLAVLPLHVQASHHVLTDTPMTFFVTLALVLALSAHERGTAAAFAWSGAAAGLAAATKYNGAIALLMPLVACLMTPRGKDSRLKCAGAAVGACVLAFFAGAPYTLLDLPTFLNAFAQLSTHYGGSGPAEVPAATYVKHLLIHFGYPAALLALAGLIMAIVRIVKGPGRARWAVLLVMPLVHFALISKQQLVYGRYLLPMVPMLCLLAANAVVSGVSLLRRYEIPRGPRAALIAGLTAAALVHPAYASIRFDRLIGRRGTTQMAYEWIRQNIPAESSVVIETRELLLPPPYRSENIGQLRSRTYEEYQERGVEYLVASGQSFGLYLANPQDHPIGYAQYMRIFQQSRELVRFVPSPDGMTVPGPELRIYRVSSLPPESSAPPRKSPATRGTP
jgi:4-amino-4-deoxy-L-arabinose transferase-like glycosyltransferase